MFAIYFHLVSLSLSLSPFSPTTCFVLSEAKSVICDLDQRWNTFFEEEEEDSQMSVDRCPTNLFIQSSQYFALIKLFRTLHLKVMLQNFHKPMAIR